MALLFAEILRHLMNRFSSTLGVDTFISHADVKLSTPLEKERRREEAVNAWSNETESETAEMK